MDDCCEPVSEKNNEKTKLCPPDFLAKYPETQTRPKNPDLVGKPSGSNTTRSTAHSTAKYGTAEKHYGGPLVPPTFFLIWFLQLFILN